MGELTHANNPGSDACSIGVSQMHKRREACQRGRPEARAEAQHRHHGIPGQRDCDEFAEMVGSTRRPGARNSSELLFRLKRR